jgi:hypothetical protein
MYYKESPRILPALHQACKCSNVSPPENISTVTVATNLADFLLEKNKAYFQFSFGIEFKRLKKSKSTLFKKKLNVWPVLSFLIKAIGLLVIP